MSEPARYLLNHRQQIFLEAVRDANSTPETNWRAAKALTEEEVDGLPWQWRPSARAYRRLFLQTVVVTTLSEHA